MFLPNTTFRDFGSLKSISHSESIYTTKIGKLRNQVVSPPATPHPEESWLLNTYQCIKWKGISDQERLVFLSRSGIILIMQNVNVVDICQWTGENGGRKNASGWLRLTLLLVFQSVLLFLHRNRKILEHMSAQSKDYISQPPLWLHVAMWLGLGHWATWLPPGISLCKMLVLIPCHSSSIPVFLPAG